MEDNSRVKQAVRAFLIVLLIQIGCMLIHFPAGVLMHPCSLAVLSLAKGKLIRLAFLLF